MSASGSPIDGGAHDSRASRGLLGRLPAWLGPRDSEPQGRGRRRRIEAAILLAIAMLITVATVYDLTREVKVDNRLTADVETWRAVTHIHDEEVAIEQDLASYSTRDTACGTVNEDKYEISARVCLMLAGPVNGNRRKVLGGFYLPPYLPIGPNDRYGCFGSTVSERFCEYLKTPPRGLPSGAPKGFHG
jgi:hypothetical protein